MPTSKAKRIAKAKAASEAARRAREERAKGSSLNTRLSRSGRVILKEEADKNEEEEEDTSERQTSSEAMEQSSSSSEQEKEEEEEVPLRQSPRKRQASRRPAEEQVVKDSSDDSSAEVGKASTSAKHTRSSSFSGISTRDFYSRREVPARHSIGQPRGLSTGRTTAAKTIPGETSNQKTSSSSSSSSKVATRSRDTPAVASTSKSLANNVQSKTTSSKNSGSSKKSTSSKPATASSSATANTSKSTKKESTTKPSAHQPPPPSPSPSPSPPLVESSGRITTRSKSMGDLLGDRIITTYSSKGITSVQVRREHVEAEMVLLADLQINGSIVAAETTINSRPVTRRQSTAIATAPPAAGESGDIDDLVAATQTMAIEGSSARKNKDNSKEGASGKQQPSGKTAKSAPPAAQSSSSTSSPPASSTAASTNLTTTNLLLSPRSRGRPTLIEQAARRKLVEEMAAAQAAANCKPSTSKQAMETSTTTSSTTTSSEPEFKVPLTRSRLSGTRPGGLKGVKTDLGNASSSPTKRPVGRPANSSPAGVPRTRTLSERKAAAEANARLPLCKPATSKNYTARVRVETKSDEDDEDEDDDKKYNLGAPTQEKIDTVARTILEGRQLRKRPVLSTEAPLKAEAGSKAKKEAQIRAQNAAKEKAAAKVREALERSIAKEREKEAKKKNKKSKGKVKGEVKVEPQPQPAPQPQQKPFRRLNRTEEEARADVYTAREVYMQVQRDNAKDFFKNQKNSSSVENGSSESASTSSPAEESEESPQPAPFKTKLISMYKSPIHQHAFAVRFCQWIGQDPLSIFAVAGGNQVSVYRILDQDTDAIQKMQHHHSSSSLKEKLAQRQNSKLGYETLFSFQDDASENFYAVNFTHNRRTTLGHPENYILAGGHKGILRIFSCTEPHLGGDGLVGHGEAINDIAVDPKAPELIFTASSDWTVRLWNLLSRRTVAVFGGWMGHCDGVLSLDVHSRLSIVASSGIDKQIMLWRYDTPDLLKSLVRSTQKPSPSDTPTTFWPPVVQVPNYETHHPHTHYVDCVRWFGDYLITRSCDRSMKMWRVADEDGEPVELTQATKKFIIRQPNRNENYKYRSNISLVHSFDFDTTDMFFVKFGLCPAGRMMAVGDDDGDAWLWDLGGAGPQAILGEVLEAPFTKQYGRVRQPVRECAINRFCTYMVCVLDGGYILLYSINKLNALAPVPPPHPRLEAAYREQERQDAERKAANEAARQAAILKKEAAELAMMRDALGNAPGTSASFREADRLAALAAAEKEAAVAALPVNHGQLNKGAPAVQTKKKESPVSKGKLLQANGEAAISFVQEKAGAKQKRSPAKSGTKVISPGSKVNDEEEPMDQS